jgi:pyridinium-3,5-bisthiocarboxylic acid mononucleotide nickel chelatase
VRIAYFDCFSGVSGDMCLGALVSAGWDRAELESLPRRLELEGVSVQVSEARRGPFIGTRVEVKIPARQPHRHLHHIESLLAAAEVAPSVSRRALQVFRRLAEAEAEVHGSTPEKVHFHEVGAADALVDIVGTLEGLDRLGVGEVFASTLRLGRGMVSSQHGPIPVPAPATALLLRGVPVEIPAIEFELVTPTGAALLATLVRRWEPPPPFRIERIGTGAGGRDLEEQPNVLRVILGEPLAGQTLGAPETGRVAVLETALDDENPQHVAALLPRLLAHGALDAMLAPVQMKKGRPGLWLVVIAPPEQADALAQMMLTETSTLGVRVREERRYELPRRLERVDTPFGPVALKVATLPGGEERASPEFESVREAAERSGRSLREISEAALAAWARSRS